MLPLLPRTSVTTQPKDEVENVVEERETSLGGLGIFRNLKPVVLGSLWRPPDDTKRPGLE